MSEGVLYSLFGQSQKLWSEFDVSLTSLRRTNPGTKICLVTNNEIVPKKFKSKIDIIIKINEPLHFFKLKVLAFLHSPFQKTIFLDLDTKVKGDISELFEFLRYYDIGVAPDPLCDWEQKDYFLDYFNLNNLNTGVLAFQKNAKTEVFIKKWLDSFIDQSDSNFLNVPGMSDDQDFFNKAIIYENQTNEIGLKLLILPNTVFNARPWIWRNMKAEKIRYRTKVIHAHKLPKTRVHQVGSILKQKFIKMVKSAKN